MNGVVLEELFRSMIEPYPDNSSQILAEGRSAPAKAQRHEQVLLLGHSVQRHNDHCQKTAKLQQPDAKQEEEASSRKTVAVLHLARGRLVESNNL